MLRNLPNHTCTKAIDKLSRSVEWSLKLADVKDDELGQDRKPLRQKLELWLQSLIDGIHELIITQRTSIKHYQIAILSPALYLLLPAADANWMPFNLNTYVAGYTYGKLETWLVRQDFSILHRGNRDYSPCSEVEQRLSFTNGCTVDIVVPKADVAFASIFQFHSMAVSAVIGCSELIPS